MPMINDEWIPPSQIIAAHGMGYFQAKYGDTPAAEFLKSEKEEEVTTTPLDAREGFTFGCDPEGFVFRDGVPVTAEGLLPGTKAKPYPLEVKGELIGYCQVDGMAAEFNIPPVSDFKAFNRCIELTIKEIDKMLPKGHELQFIPAVTFDQEVFDAAPDKAKELGCSPDYDAWAGRVNPPPKDPENPYLRTASGHLHIGWTKDADLSDSQHILNCCDLVKMFDWYLGLWSIKLDPDPIRRRLYGKAGACRLKDYGVEYRVLSNFWVTSRERRLAVWNRMQAAIKDMAKSFLPDKASDYNPFLIESINTSALHPIIESNYQFPVVSLTRPISSASGLSRNKIKSYGLSMNAVIG